MICIDSNADHCKAAENDCTRVIYGNGLQARHLMRAEIDTRRGALALTANDEVNYLFIQKVKEEAKEIPWWADLKSDSASLTTKMLHKSGAELAFGATVDVDTWDRRLKERQVHLQLWRCDTESPEDADNGPMLTRYPGNGMIPVALRRTKELTPVGDGRRFKTGDEVYYFVFEREIDAVAEFLSKQGWRCLEQVDKDAFTTWFVYSKSKADKRV